MAEQQNMENNNLETKEPLPKIQKIDQNGESSTRLPLLKIKKSSEKAILPSRVSSLSAGYDLYSAHDTEVPARGKALIRTDLSIAIPEETYARIAPRLKLAWKNSIHVGAGVVDADYRGLVGVILYNYSHVDFKVNAGDRIAQLIIKRIMTPEVLEVEDLDSTVRGNREIKEPLLNIQKIDENGGSPTLPPLLKVKKLSEKAILPSVASSLSAGYDLSSAQDTEVPARGKALIRTDLSIAIPEETYGRIAPRSGLAWKNSINVGAGVVDADYRGQVGVILYNHSDVDFKVKAGDRIAQLIIERIMTPEVLEVEDLDSTSITSCLGMVEQQKTENNILETEEPLPKIQKVDQYGVSPTHPPLLKVRKLSENAILPSRPSPLSAGYDLSSAYDAEVPARGKALIQTDLSITIPEETHGRIAPCFGLAWKNFIDVGAGVIDSDHRGPVGVILYNHFDVDFKIKAGDRIAQLIIERIMTLEVLEVEDLDSTVRGVGGFGSTGVRSFSCRSNS